MTPVVPPFTVAPRILALLLGSLLCSCVSVDYDLGEVSIPVSARPAPEGMPTEAFEVKDPYFLYVHGLCGESVPDVAEMLEEATAGASAVHDFRVTLRSGFSHWLLTHLSLGLIRSRSVVVSGSVVRE